MSDERHSSDELVRSQTFDADGPLELDVDVTAGRVEIHLTDGDTLVEIRTDPSAQPSWAEGAAGVLNWVGDFFGGQFGGQLGNRFGAEALGSPADAVQQTRIEKVGNRLLVRGPKPPPPMATPIAVTVRAPAGSHLHVRSRLAAVTVTGATGRIDVATGPGDVTLERADGSTTVRTSGGAVDIATLAGPATVSTGSGAVRLGEVTEAVMVRTSSGEVSVASAASGAIEAISGSGDIRTAVAPGATAEIDLSSGGGRVRSDLDVSDTPPDSPAALTVRARSGSGDVLVTAAA